MTGFETVADRIAKRSGCRAVSVRPRCYVCGDPAIAALCCVCHNLLCSAHDRRTDLADLRPRRRGKRPTAAAEETEKGAEEEELITAVDAPSREEALGRAPLRTVERHFCRECEPAVHGRDVELVAACVQTAVGVVLATMVTWWGGLLVLVGIMRLSRSLVTGYRRRRSTRQKYRTTLFLDPRLVGLRLVETVSATQRLSTDERPPELMITGLVELDAAWSRAHTAQIAQWRRRSGDDQARVPISSGAVLLSGSARIRFVPTSANDATSNSTVRQHPAVLPLRPIDHEHPVLIDGLGRGDPRWEVRAEYVLEDSAHPPRPLVWVTPAVAPGSGGRALDIEVQWCLYDVDASAADVEAAPRAKQIEELRLVVPAAWGAVRNATSADQVTVSSAIEKGTQTIEWRRPIPSIEKQPRGRCHFSVSFDHPLAPESTSVPEVTAFVIMAFQGALSGAQGVRVHAAGGARRQDGAAASIGFVETRVELEAQLDLGSLRHQAVRAVPDPRRDGDRTVTENRRFPSVAPDHHTVALLTDLLSDQGYYVKRVVENPAQPGRSADLLSRFWDIAGRRYNGVHPIDFHLLLMGDQARAGSRESSTTIVRLDLHGTFANEQMERQIVEEYDQLWARIDSSIYSAGLDGRRERPSGIPVDAASAEVGRLRNVALTVRSRLRDERHVDGIRTELAAELIAVIDREFGLDDRTG